jgi:hypothetical protein
MSGGGRSLRCWTDDDDVSRPRRRRLVRHARVLKVFSDRRRDVGGGVKGDARDVAAAVSCDAARMSGSLWIRVA